MSVITLMAANLLLEPEASGIRSLGRAGCEAVIAAVVTNTAAAANAVEALIARPTAPEATGQQ